MQIRRENKGGGGIGAVSAEVLYMCVGDEECAYL